MAELCLFMGELKIRVDGLAMLSTRPTKWGGFLGFCFEQDAKEDNFTSY